MCVNMMLNVCVHIECVTQRITTHFDLSHLNEYDIKYVC